MPLLGKMLFSAHSVISPQCVRCGGVHCSPPLLPGRADTVQALEGYMVHVLKGKLVFFFGKPVRVHQYVSARTLAQAETPFLCPLGITRDVILTT